MPVTRELRGQPRYHVELDLTGQVLALSIPEETTWEEGEEALSPVCSGGPGFVSASMLALEAKLFDDGLYAAVDLLAQRGAGRFAGKSALLSKLVRHAPLLAAAASLGGMDVSLDEEAMELREEFLANQLKSKPLGFYTWSPELRRIFQQDRLLQDRLDAEPAKRLAAALLADPVLATAYGAYLDLVARLTNPLVPEKPDLRQPNGCYFFPPSRAHETDLMKRLFGPREIPEGFELAAEMIRRIRDGSLSLEPSDVSGWYDWQAWALEPLVKLESLPEGARLRMDRRYKEQLEELFKAVIALTRETHVKQLEMLELGAAMSPREPKQLVWVAPELTLEPVLSYYERRAAGYDFVRGVLEGAFGAEALRATSRQGPAGGVGRPLLDELLEIAGVFRGAAAVVAKELGIRPAADPDAALFRAWAAADHAGGHGDVRMMVPVFYDLGRRKTKVWMVLGWSTRQLLVGFATPPTARVLAGNVSVRFGMDRHTLAFPVFAEAYVDRLLDRDEFRAHCDRHRTRSQILAKV